MPRALGIAAPSGEDVWEIYLQVHSRPSILGKVSDALGNENIDILGAHVQVSDDRKVGHLILYLEMAGASVTMAQMADRLRGMDFVIDVQTESKRKVVFESQMFPLTSAGHYRGFFIGASSWAALVDAISDQFGSGSDVILQAEGVSVGRDVATKIKEKLARDGGPGADNDSAAMVANVAAVFRADGMGLLELSPAEGAASVGVRISDFASAQSDHLDHFLVGFVKGAVEGAYSSKYAAESLRLAGKSIEFTLKRRADASVA